MTLTQQEDLFAEWDLYEEAAQDEMVTEYRLLEKGNYSKDSFLLFLQKKLEIEGYWKKIGLL